MNNAQRLNLCLFIASTFLLSCEKSVSPKEDPIKGDQNAAGIPFAVGNIWMYKLTYFDSGGNITNTTNSSVEILRDTTIQGVQWFVARNSDNVTTYLSIERNNSNAHFVWRASDSTTQLNMKYPPIISDTFFVSLYLSNGGRDTNVTYSIKVSQSSSVINVPNGRFYVFKYSNDSFSFSWNGMGAEVLPTDIYLSNIGKIKCVRYGKTQVGAIYIKSIEELVSCSIK